MWLRWCFGRCLFFGRCLWRRWCSGHRRAWLLGVPVGGGFSAHGACGAGGVLGVVGPGCCVCRSAVALLLAVLVVPLAFRARPISGRRVSCPPARRLRCELSARRVVSNPGLALQASRRPLIGRCLSLVCCRSGPCGVLRTGGACVADRRLGASSRTPDWPVGLPPWPATTSWPVGTAISHAIPLYLFQTLNSNRWNCNVFRCC